MGESDVRTLLFDEEVTQNNYLFQARSYFLRELGVDDKQDIEFYWVSRILSYFLTLCSYICSLAEISA